MPADAEESMQPTFSFKASKDTKVALFPPLLAGVGVRVRQVALGMDSEALFFCHINSFGLLTVSLLTSDDSLA